MLLSVNLDSESLPFLEESLDAGELPNLAALMRGGTRHSVEAGAMAGLPYITFYSGQPAAERGVYFPIQWDAATQSVIPWTRIEKNYPALVERIDRAGIRMVMLDPPEMVPCRLQHGLAVSGLQFRARVLLHSWSSDETRAEALRRLAGPAPRADEVFGRPEAGVYQKISAALRESPARLAAAALASLDADCLWLNFCAMHLAAHLFFDLALLEDREARRKLADTRRVVARGYDRLLGDVLDRLPAGSTVFAFYAKGMIPAYGWIDLLPEMLDRVLGQAPPRSPVRALRALVPGRVRRMAADRLADETALDVLARMSTPRVDWRKTRAFCLPSDCPGFVRVNLAGREKEGCVTEREREALLAEIRAGLETFTDFDGEPCVAKIRPPEEMLGPKVDRHAFPDLILEWNRKPTLLGGGVRSARYGEIRRKGVSTGRSGHHGPGAMAVLAPGAGLRAATPREDGLRLEDIPATFAAALGLPDAGLAGHPWLERPPVG